MLSQKGQDDLYSRRAFVTLAGQTVLLGVAAPFFVASCNSPGSTTGSLDAKTITQDAGNALAVAGGVIALIPTIQSKTVAGIVSLLGVALTAVSDLLPDPPDQFDPGATLRGDIDKLQKLSPAALAEGIVEEITRAFAQKGDGQHFDTPVIQANGNASLVLQIQANHHSLLRGADGSAYQVRNKWVDWLLKDACDLRVDSDTDREECSYCKDHGHSLYVMRQRFRDRSDDSIEIMHLDQDHPDQQALDFHFSHTKAFVPCLDGGPPDDAFRVEIPVDELPSDEVPEESPSLEPDPAEPISEPDPEMRSDGTASDRG